VVDRLVHDPDRVGLARQTEVVSAEADHRHLDAGAPETPLRHRACGHVERARPRTAADRPGRRRPALARRPRRARRGILRRSITGLGAAGRRQRDRAGQPPEESTPGLARLHGPPPRRRRCSARARSALSGYAFGMADPARRRATYADLCAVPENLIAEIIHGTLYTQPRPATPHARAASRLGVDLGGPF